jgi:hypothetical protein
LTGNWVECDDDIISDHGNSLPADRQKDGYILFYLNRECFDMLRSYNPHLPSLSIPRCHSLLPFDRVLLECHSPAPIDFAAYLMSSGLKLKKMSGRGSFGNVFAAELNGKQLAIKVIPIDGVTKIGGFDQTRSEQLLPELLISQAVGNLRCGIHNRTNGFVELHGKIPR